MNKKADHLVDYGVTALVAAVFVWLALWLREYNGAEALVERYRIFCDAFTIPGILLTMTYLLIVLSKHGALDGVGYGLRRLLNMLIPVVNAKFESYADYIESKAEKRAKPAPRAMLHVGLACMAIALIFLALFYHVYEG